MTIAVVESPGMPNTSVGIQALASAALFADALSTIPSTCPFPYRSRCREQRLLTA